MRNSNFDTECNHWEGNRSQYRGIRPDEASKRWRAVAQKRGKHLDKSYDSLQQAQEAINTFRQSAGEG